MTDLRMLDPAEAAEALAGTALAGTAVAGTVVAGTALAGTALAGAECAGTELAGPGLAAGGGAARGFLGTDPVTQNRALLAAELTRMGATVCQAGDALVGFAHRPGQPRQALVASTSGRPEPVAALLAFLRTYHRSTSYLALVPDGSPVAAAFTGCGFRPAGVLREHRYGAGQYHDVLVYVAKAAGTTAAGTTAAQTTAAGTTAAGTTGPGTTDPGTTEPDTANAADSAEASRCRS
jgi:hypothetical protein